MVAWSIWAHNNHIGLRPRWLFMLSVHYEPILTKQPYIIPLITRLLNKYINNLSLKLTQTVKVIQKSHAAPLTSVTCCLGKQGSEFT